MVVSPWELSVQWEVPATPTPPVYIVAWWTDQADVKNVSMYVCILCIYVLCMYVCMCICVCMYGCMYVCMYVCMSLNT